uniref:Uncharacterized protein n=1 Tax=Lepeophtheirus salmonis TaxID=72036 RepID=A0A0K2T8R8_LEPSM
MIRTLVKHKSHASCRYIRSIFDSFFYVIKQYPS